MGLQPLLAVMYEVEGGGGDEDRRNLGLSIPGLLVRSGCGF